MKLSPLGDKIVVKVDDNGGVTAGGIHLPDNAQTKPTRGTVVAVGPGRMLENGVRNIPGVVAGDSVIFSKYAGSEVEVGGEEFTIIDADSVFAIVEGAA